MNPPLICKFLRYIARAQAFTLQNIVVMTSEEERHRHIANMGTIIDAMEAIEAWHQEGDPRANIALNELLQGISLFQQERAL